MSISKKMGKQNFFYLNRNRYVFLSIFLFSFIFLLNGVSATASFYSIPQQNLGFNDFKTINLNSYCTSSTQGNNCRASSYYVEFENPDFSRIETIYGGQSRENSFFKIELTTDGLIYLNSKSKNAVIQVVVYGADAEYSSQASTSFFFSIAQNQEPIQIASFYAPVLYGNQSVSYNLNNFFTNYTSARVTFNDDVLMQTISLQQEKTIGFKSSNGSIKVTLAGTGASIILTIQGLNREYNASITGGNLFYVTAINSYGETTDIGFPVIVYANYTLPTFNGLPIRAPYSIAPFYMNYNQTRTFNLSNLYSNFSMINITFRGFGTGSKFLMYRNGTGIYCNVAESVCSTSVQNQFDGSLYDFAYPEGFRVILYKDFMLQVDSLTNYSNLAPLNFSACNNNGCIYQDDFGNKDILYVNITGSPPQAVPLSFDAITLGYGETALFDFNKMFSNFDYIILNWSESGTEYSLISPSTSYNQSTYISGGTPIYQARIYFNELFSLTASQTNHNVTFYPTACNSIGCVNGTLGINQSIMFIIQDTTRGTLGESYISSGYFRSLFNTIFNLFPDEETLTSKQKSNFVMIVMAVVTLLIVFLGYSSGAEIKYLIYLAGIINFIVFLFFLFKGYVSLTIIATLILTGVMLVFFKLWRK